MSYNVTGLYVTKPETLKKKPKKKKKRTHKLDYQSDEDEKTKLRITRRRELKRKVACNNVYAFVYDWSDIFGHFSNYIEKPSNHNN